MRLCCYPLKALYWSLSVSFSPAAVSPTPSFPVLPRGDSRLSQPHFTWHLTVHRVSAKSWPSHHKPPGLFQVSQLGGSFDVFIESFTIGQCCTATAVAFTLSASWHPWTAYWPCLDISLIGPENLVIKYFTSY
ncbi:hypothetical protein DER46DRAFT_392189 [Fusarium sp. MPI-SDFR-AT-0072]|nr:hypothetical protein DER46DRAFT_392189 [Fusarium sp. MPI-SDFR-AT-0072]